MYLGYMNIILKAPLLAEWNIMQWELCGSKSWSRSHTVDERWTDVQGRSTPSRRPRFCVDVISFTCREELKDTVDWVFCCHSKLVYVHSAHVEQIPSPMQLWNGITVNHKVWLRRGWMFDGHRSHVIMSLSAWGEITKDHERSYCTANTVRGKTSTQLLLRWDPAIP